MRKLVDVAVLAVLVVIGLFCWGVGTDRLPVLTGQWVVDTTPMYKGHVPGYTEPIAVCVHTRTGEEKRVRLTDAQAFGDASGNGWIKKDEPCP